MYCIIRHHLWSFPSWTVKVKHEILSLKHRSHISAACQNMFSCAANRRSLSSYITSLKSHSFFCLFMKHGARTGAVYFFTLKYFEGKIKVRSWPWKQMFAKLSHLKVHFVTVLELSIILHDLHQQVEFAQWLWRRLSCYHVTQVWNSVTWWQVVIYADEGHEVWKSTRKWTLWQESFPKNLKKSRMNPWAQFLCYLIRF